jgi:hypothetical protein
MVNKRRGNNGSVGQDPTFSWRKSSHSADSGNCVNVGTRNGLVAIGDTKRPEGRPVITTAASWRGFIYAVKKVEMITPTPGIAPDL